MFYLNRFARLVLPLSLGLLFAAGVRAAGEVSSIQVMDAPATPFRYTASDGVTYTWGLGSNQLMEGFVVAGVSYGYVSSADRVELQRHDVTDVSNGLPCGVFVERFGGSSVSLAADYPSDGSGTGNCDMAALLASRVINRGAVDLFSNRLPDAKNIERADYLFDSGIIAPLDRDALAYAGHNVAEKRGNNSVKIAAILSLDVFGQPDVYGPLITINRQGCSDPDLCYGITDMRHNYAFFQNDYLAPQGYPWVTETSIESVAMAFVSAERLGLSVGQRYFGFSLFADDVDDQIHALTDPATFPTDTANNSQFGNPGDDADIYGGMSGYFVSAELNVSSGRVFIDEDGDGMVGVDEAGISNISISIYVDVDNNGAFDPAIDTQTGETGETDLEGQFLFPGLPDGNYFVLLDENDPELPPGLAVMPGSNPQPMSVAGGSPEPVNFVFSDPVAMPDTGEGDTDEGDTGEGDTGEGDTGEGDTGEGDTDEGDTDEGDTDEGDTGEGDTGEGDTGEGDTDEGDTDEGDAGEGDAGEGDTGEGDTGESDTGESSPPGSPAMGDDVVTNATHDSFDVDQGSTIFVDVLANDSDGAGNGLTLSSVSESPNATIEVIDNQIRYTADYGFYGTDNFSYTIVDGNGVEDTGTVTANVIRFSDINNNGLNDFVECDCTELSLETGIHGSGVGRMSTLLLMAMAGLAGWRNRARRRYYAAVQAKSGETS
ncbi:MAG: Ig-like domain-containing protein [Granulosicoccus sp.]